jgi:hypothetical protein
MGLKSLELEMRPALPLHSELYLLTFAFGGLTLKLADFTGERGGLLIPYLTAGLSALFFAILIGDNPSSSAMVIGIIVGSALSLKLDRPNLVFGLVATVLIAIMLGFKTPLPWLLILVSASSFIDEVGHNRLDRTDHRLRPIFRHRLILKTVIALLTASRLLSIIHGLGFFCFDLTYDATNWLLGHPRS